MAQFDAAGSHRWSQCFGDADYQSATALQFAGEGRVVVGGDFAGMVDFGGGNLGYAGATDVFVAVFGD